MTVGRVFCLLVVFSILTVSDAFSQNAQLPERRWVFALTDLKHEEQQKGRDNLGLNDLIKLMDKMQQTDPQYNGMVIQDAWFSDIPGQEPQYRENLMSVRTAAKARNLEIIPMILPTGGAGSLLSADADMAEGVPVRNCRFVVKKTPGGDLQAEVENQSVHVANGDFANKFSRWIRNSDPADPEEEFVSVVTDADRGGRVVQFRKGDEGRFSRIAQTLKLKPFHQYELAFHIKTDKPFGDDELPFYYLLNVDVSRDLKIKKLLTRIHFVPNKGEVGKWVEFRIVFNTFKYRDVELSFNLEADGGPDSARKILIDDVSVREIAGFNLLRREGCPLRVVDANDGTVYHEGDGEGEHKDFMPWADPFIHKNSGFFDYGTVPDSHLPLPIQIPQIGSNLKEGQDLLVSFYHAMTMTAGGTHTPCCLSHDKVFELYQTEFEQCRELLGADTWILNHDEIFLARQCKLCRKAKSPAILLGDHIIRVTKMVRAIDPDAEVFTLNDMFDPHHNAFRPEDGRSFFPHVAGSWQRAWSDIPEGVKIYNWNFLELCKSLPHFNSREQVFVGYYDVDEKDFDAEAKLQLKQAHEHGVVGVTYATYKNQYCRLSDYAKHIKKAWSQ